MSEETDATKYPKIKVRLSGQDGNAFAVIGRVRAALRRGKVPDAEIDTFTEEANSGDHDNVLRTAMRWVDVS